MVDKDQIEQWLKDGTVTKEQAQKMLADASKYTKEQRSNKFIVAISTIGATLLGIGVLLFVASNWEAIPDFIKVLILCGSTGGSFYLGYMFKYEKQNYIMVGAALIFLAALLFGATVFLIAQIYHINANNHTLILIWLLGVVPLVYILKSPPITVLTSFLFFLWLGFFVFKNEGEFFAAPVFYLIAGVLLFAIGGLHYFSEKLKEVARTYRIVSIQVGMLCLFLLSFRFFSGVYEYYGDKLYNIRAGLQISPDFIAWLTFFAVLAIIFSVINLFFNPPKTDTALLEGSISLGLLGIALIFFFYPPATTNIYVLLFNLILAGIVFALLYVGYQREDIKLINIGMAYLAILVIVRYFDFFWGLLPRSIFFMVGGLILILGGIALETKRRELKEKFAA
ncbi:MAG: DUF2157 domain-containing protein [Candidatus Margulisiibacteriota bacterium]